MKPSLVIAGLGNVGKNYEKTRHNVGFRAIDGLAEQFATGDWIESGKFDALSCEARVGVAPVLLLKPQLFMNRSGESLKKVVDFYKLDVATQLLVLCDDIDLPLGTLRLRLSGGPGTHNGLKSIVEQLGEVFPRLRIGIGAQPAGEDLAAWVLSIPPADDQRLLESACEEIPDLVRKFVMERLS